MVGGGEAGRGGALGRVGCDQMSDARMVEINTKFAGDY